MTGAHIFVGRLSFSYVASAEQLAMYVSRVSLLGLNDVSPGLEPAIEAGCKVLVPGRVLKRRMDLTCPLADGPFRGDC